MHTIIVALYVGMMLLVAAEPPETLMPMALMLAMAVAYFVLAIKHGD